MKNFRIILASNSPRRKELLAGLDIPFEVKVIQGIDESYPESLPAYETALYIAVKKRRHTVLCLILPSSSRNLPSISRNLQMISETMNY